MTLELTEEEVHTIHSALQSIIDVMERHKEEYKDQESDLMKLYELQIKLVQQQ